MFYKEIKFETKDGKSKEYVSLKDTQYNYEEFSFRYSSERIAGWLNPPRDPKNIREDLAFLRNVSTIIVVTYLKDDVTNKLTVIDSSKFIVAPKYIQVQLCNGYNKEEIVNIEYEFEIKGGINNG